MLQLRVALLACLISSPLLSQEQENPLEASTQEIQQEEISNRLPDISQLRLDFINSTLEADEVYRLAGFYLSAKAYGKSAELYGQFLSMQVNNLRQKASAYYNRALSLFSLKNYDASAVEFENAYHYDNNLYDSLRMLGTISFIQKNKANTIDYWKQYLVANTNTSPERTAIEMALAKINTPDFVFETPEKEKSFDESTTNLWPFSNPDSLPYPDAEYIKKRII